MDDDNTYELIGRATVAWSDVEVVWYQIFLALSDMPRSQADSLYITPRSFSLERQFSLNLAKAVLIDEAKFTGKSKEAIKTKLMDLAKSSEKAASKRNKVAHAKYIKSSDRDVKSLGIWRMGEEGRQLSEANLSTDLQNMEKEFSTLTDELTVLLFRICEALGKEPPEIEN